MNKKILLKVISLVVLNVFIISSGISTFAAIKEPDSINWSYLHSCAHAFELAESTASIDKFLCGADTTCAPSYKAYVKVQVQYLTSDGWEDYLYMEDLDYGVATCERTVAVMPGYTYRLYLTHKVLNSNDVVLETFGPYESDNYLTSLRRS